MTGATGSISFKVLVTYQVMSPSLVQIGVDQLCEFEPPRVLTRIICRFVVHLLTSG